MSFPSALANQAMVYAAAGISSPASLVKLLLSRPVTQGKAF